MIDKNTQSKNIGLIRQKIETTQLKAHQSFNISSKTFKNTETISNFLSTRFMAEPLLIMPRQSEDLSLRFSGNADPYLGVQTSTDKLLEETLHHNNQVLIKDILSNNYDAMSHNGLIHNIGVMEHINAIYFIPDAVKAFMAKKDGLDNHFDKLTNLLLSQNKVTYHGERMKTKLRQNLFNFVDIYSPYFTKKMLMGSLKICIRHHELECFNRLIRINRTKISQSENDNLRILINAQKSRSHKKTILFAYAIMS